MKIYIALFTTLIAAGHFTNVSAADAAASVDGASHPHLRALADVDVACRSGCNNDNHCSGSVCSVNGGSDCSGVCCSATECNANGDGCPSGAKCDTGYDGSTSGCHGCLISDNGFVPHSELKQAASTPVDVDVIEEVEEEEEVDSIQDHEDDVEASSLRASILKEE